jgi:hypothetical protein
VLDIVRVEAPRPRDAAFRGDPRFLSAAARVRAMLFRDAA